MITLQGEHIYLRALELEDLDFVYEIENNQDIWEISNTITPYSKFLIKQYLDQSHKDIYEVKQLRLVICSADNIAIGMIDMFDFDIKNKRAGVGILIKESVDRQKGFGQAALQLLVNYCKSHLDIHQLFCNISEDNVHSLKLFQKQGFSVIGLKKDWNYVNGSYKNEYLLQSILHVH